MTPAFAVVGGTTCTLLDLDSLLDIAFREHLTVEYPPPGESGHAKTFVESEKRWVAAAYPREGSPERAFHMPHCNTGCEPDVHYLSEGVGMPHIHRTDLSGQCGSCTQVPTP